MSLFDSMSLTQARPYQEKKISQLKLSYIASNLKLSQDGTTYVIRFDQFKDFTHYQIIKDVGEIIKENQGVVVGGAIRVMLEQVLNGTTYNVTKDIDAFFNNSLTDNVPEFHIKLDKLGLCTREVQNIFFEHNYREMPVQCMYQHSFVTYEQLFEKMDLNVSCVLYDPMTGNIVIRRDAYNGIRDKIIKVNTITLRRSTAAHIHRYVKHYGYSFTEESFFEFCQLYRNHDDADDVVDVSNNGTDHDLEFACAPQTISPRRK